MKCPKKKEEKARRLITYLILIWGGHFFAILFLFWDVKVKFMEI